MKTVSIRRCPGELRRILTAAAQEDVVVRPPQGGEILLSLIDDFDYEIAAQRRNPKLMAFLEERFRQARKEKGVPLEEVKRRLGLRRRSSNNQRPHQEAPLVRGIDVSARSQAILDLLEQARSEDVILKTTNGSECFLSAVPDGDYKAANQHRSEVVMAYLDELGDQGKLPPLEVVFVRELPRSVRQRPKKRRPRKRI